MYIIKNMDFYIQISDAVPDDEENTFQKMDYVRDCKDATQFETMSDAASLAEKMSVSGFTIEKL